MIAQSGLARPVFLPKRRRGDEQLLSEVIVGDGESFEAALRRFNKKIQQAGILAEARRREFYERPAARRKRKEAKRGETGLPQWTASALGGAEADQRPIEAAA